jgi:lipoate-protein ligase A
MQRFDPITAMNAQRQLFQNFEQQGSEEIDFNFYHFSKPTITYGYTLKIEDFIDLAAAKSLGFACVRRPTGGGFVIHHPQDLIFYWVASLKHPHIPNGLNESFLWLADLFKQALAECGVGIEISAQTSQGFEPVCFAHAREFEINYRGKKILGIAQRRGKNALLMQGSLALQPIDPAWQGLLKDQSLWKKMLEGGGYVPSLDVAKFRQVFERIYQDFRA